MHSVMEIAEAVCQKLADFCASVELSPDYDLPDLKNMRVVVIPTGKTIEMAGRRLHDNRIQVDVGILKRVHTMADKKQLMNLAEDVADRFFATVLTDGVSWESSEFDPVFSPEYMRTDQFVSIIHLTFREVE